MSEEKKHIFDQYVVQGKPVRKQCAENWQNAIGLQDMDQPKNSPCLCDTAKQHIEGTVDIATEQKRIVDHYRTEKGHKLAADRTDEADIAAGIMQILQGDTFSFIPAEYAQLHRRLFEDMFSHAGEYRTFNIFRKEWLLWMGKAYGQLPDHGSEERSSDPNAARLGKSAPEGHSPVYFFS